MGYLRLPTTKQWCYALQVSKKFIRKVEDFTCENCGTNTTGDGYTNHCPECLWSKHVDINPGDRAAQCGGLMKPIEVIQSAGTYILTHKCIRCQYIKKNKLARNDSMDAAIALAENLAKTNREPNEKP